MRLFGADLQCKKGYVATTHRLRSPAETVETYSRFAESMGITRLANVTGLDRVGVPVYMCVRPNGRCLSVAQGKGVDAASAKASALMESIECWHAERLRLPVLCESHRALKSEARVVDIHALPIMPGLSVDIETVPIRWLRGHDLMSGEQVYVPFDIASLNFVTPETHLLFEPSSNGLASGNHILEAITHSLCEIIERDNCYRFPSMSLSEQQARQLDLNTVDDSHCQYVLERFAQAGLNVAVWDVAPADSIPTYTCLIWERSSLNHKGVFFGEGAHLSPAIALLRALTEAAQYRLTYIAGSRDDLPPGPYTYRAGETVLEKVHRALTPEPPVSFTDRASLATESFEDDIALLTRCLTAAELLEAVVLDLTVPEMGIPVAMVCVPGSLDVHVGAAARQARAQF